MFFIMGKKSLTPNPRTLDVVGIDGKLAQVVSAGADEGDVIFLDDRVKLGINLQLSHLHHINWNDYDFEKSGEENCKTVSDLRERGEISLEEYMAVHWGPEQEENPYLRGRVTFFGRYELRNR